MSMSDEDKKIEAVEEKVETPEQPKTKPEEAKAETEAPKEESKDESKEAEEEVKPPSAEVTAAAEEAATPETKDEAIPEEVKGKAEKVEFPNRDIQSGMWVRVHERIKDVNSKGEEKERVQVFEGLVIGVKGAEISRTMTVRKNSKGWMVEKIFPLASPNIEKVEVVKQYRTRRAKLSYLRGRFRRKLKEIK